MAEDQTLPTPEEQPLSPQDLSSILDDFKSFGILDNEDIVTLNVGGRRLQVRITNVTNEDEIFSMVRCEGLKGYAWIQRLRCEILARSISWLNGVDLQLEPYATDPYTKEDRPVRLILVDLFMHWGQEAVLTLWRVYMVHCQRLEDNLGEQLPDSLVMTEAERRFMERVGDELAAAGAMAIQEATAAATSPLTSESEEA